MTKDQPEVEGQGRNATTILPLEIAQDSPQVAGSSLLFVADEDQHNDHGGLPIEPVTSGGVPYRYKVRFRGFNVYALTPDEVLALFIGDPDYDPNPDQTYTEMSDDEATDHAADQVTRRAQHCRTILIDHAAQAIMSGQADQEQIKSLQAASDVDHPPTIEDCPRWTAPVPLLLIGELYPVEDHELIPARTPPMGNVEYLHPGEARHYVSDLARLGYINLQENPAYTSPPRVDMISVDESTDPGGNHGEV